MIVTAIERDCELEESKLFGEVYLPDEWLENDVFLLDEFFVGQLNLSTLSCPYLPQSGFLYFFIETKNFRSKNMKAVVRYFELEPDASTEFNDGLFVNEKTFALVQGDDGGDVKICELNENDCLQISLLSISERYFPFDCDFNTATFQISIDDLKNKKFDNCTLKFEVNPNV